MWWTDRACLAFERRASVAMIGKVRFIGRFTTEVNTAICTAEESSGRRLPRLQSRNERRRQK